ncbi:MAG TPA: KGG domain-containing protein [Vicinamibacterales bacterium]|nr:KGG domain-containing protein [Vicinamibacterales bacterium]
MAEGAAVRVSVEMFFRFTRVVPPPAENIFLSPSWTVIYGNSVVQPLQPVRSEAGGRVAKEDRGFASMDRAKQREIASKGGKAAHQKGTAHEWTSEEAREAGRKGGMASHRRKQQQQGEPGDANLENPTDTGSQGAADDTREQ